MNADNLDIRLLRYRSRREDSPHELAHLLLEAQRPGEALEVVRLALIERPDVDLMVLEGRAWFDQSALPEAQEALMRAVKADPRNKEPYRWLAQVLMKRGEPGRAVQVLERALHIDGTDRQLQQAHMRAQRLARIADDTDLMAEDKLVAPAEPQTHVDPFVDGQAHTLRPAQQQKPVPVPVLMAQPKPPEAKLPAPKLPEPKKPAPVVVHDVSVKPSPSDVQAAVQAAVRESFPDIQNPEFGDDAPTAAFEMPAEILNWLEAERTQGMSTQPPAPMPSPTEAMPSPVLSLSKLRESAEVASGAPDFPAALSNDPDASLELRPPSAAEAEPPEQVLSVLSEQGIFEQPGTKPAVEWAKKAETPRPGTRLGKTLAASWVFAFAAAGGGYYGFNYWLEQRRVDAQALIATAAAEIADGQHVSLLAAEGRLLEARTLDAKSSAAVESLLFVQTARALEDPNADVGYLRTTLARAETLEVSPALVLAGKAFVSAVDRDTQRAQELASGALVSGKDDARVLYLVARLYQRSGRAEARGLLQQASSKDASLALAFAAEAEMALAEKDFEAAQSLLKQALGADGKFLRAELWQLLLDVTPERALALKQTLAGLEGRIAQGAAPDQLLALLVGSRIARTEDDLMASASLLEGANALSVSDPELMSLLGQEALAVGKLDLAYRATNAATVAAPLVQRYREDLVQVLLARGDGRTALRSMDGLDDANGSFAMYAEARAALLSGSSEALAEAKKRLSSYRASAAGRADVEASALLLRTDLKLGANAESLLPTARTLAQQNPTSGISQLALGEAALLSGQGALALTALAKAELVSPSDADVYYLRGRAQRLVGKPAEAKADFLKALSLAPAHLQARETLGGLLVDAGEYDAAIEVFAKLEQEGRGLSGALGAIEAMLGRGDVARAEAKFEKLSEAERAQSAASVVAARIAIANKKAGDAVKRLEPLVAKDADTRNAQVLSVYGEALYADDKVDSAAGAFEAALEFDAAYPEALIGRAMTAVRAEKVKDAKLYLASAESALVTRVRPPKLRALYLLTLAKTQVLDQEWEPAKLSLQRALELGVAPTETHFWLGEVLTKTKSPGASESYAKYLELAPTGTFAGRAKRALAPR